MRDDRVLIVFGRYPRLGKVKTRLSSHLPQQQVLRLYEAFLLDTIESSLSPTNWQTRLYLADCSPQERSEWREKCGFSPDLQILPQRGRDLGERMWYAYRETSARYTRIVFIGADTPGLPPGVIEDAFRALEDHALVLGPVPDGGYYLLGLSSPHRQIFVGIDWGSERVLEQTLEKVPSEDVLLLPPWNDVDEISDLEDLHNRLALKETAPAPRTRAELDRLSWQRE